MNKTSSNSVVRIGIAGFGTAGRSFLPAIEAHPGFQLVAVADPVATVREEIAREQGVPGYATVQELLTHPGLDAVYIATPTRLHEEQVLLAAQAGKHVLVEKPMAVNASHALPMVEAAEKAGIVFLVGHSHGYDLPVLEMRKVIESGRLGRVRMVNSWDYTDWMCRPRRDDELDETLGGGVTYRQGAHQIDVIRLLCGGRTRSVRAKTYSWDPQKKGIGAHTLFMDFEDGVGAMASYNGYGYFSSVDICFNVTESGFHQESGVVTRARMQAAAKQSPEDVLKAKLERARKASYGPAPHQPMFGMTIVSCERGDIRQSANGLLIYSDAGMEEIALPLDKSPRDLVLMELYDAITGSARPVHSGRWGLANLEVCDAAIESSASGREILLKHQVGLPS